MVKGYVLVSVAPGREMEAFRGFRKVKAIKESVPLLGDIDFILIVEAKEPNDIARTVIKHIRPIPGVVSTKTLVQDDFLKHFEELA